MKKYLAIVILIILITALTACGNDKKIVLPESEKIKVNCALG